MESIKNLRKQLGKTNKAFITRELPVSANCGHKFDPEIPPSKNCDHCWFLFFNQSGELVQDLDKEYHNDKRQLINTYGDKFVKNFARFMHTVSEFRKAKDEETVA